MRSYRIQSWNWSDRAKKWVFVKLKNGKRIYKYQKEAPREYDDLTGQIRLLNLQLLMEPDLKNNVEIYRKMIKVSQQLQAMKR